MTNPLTDTLEALQKIQDAIETIKTRKTIESNTSTISDYEKIISYLEDSASDLINAVVIFQKHEKVL